MVALIYLAAGAIGVISGGIAAPLGCVPVSILKMLLAPALGDWIWVNPVLLAYIFFLPVGGAIFGLFGGLIGATGGGLVGAMISRKRTDEPKIQLRIQLCMQWTFALLGGAVCGFLVNFAISPMAQ